jgi:hypothetical protein
VASSDDDGFILISLDSIARVSVLLKSFIFMRSQNIGSKIPRVHGTPFRGEVNGFAKPLIFRVNKGLLMYVNIGTPDGLYLVH